MTLVWNLFTVRRRAPARTIRDVLTEIGVSDEEIARAEADGTDELLAIDYLVLPERTQFTIEELAVQSGLSVEIVRAVWRAVGFADPVDDERPFSARDVDMFAKLAETIGTGLVEGERAMQMIRVLGSSMARFATAVVDSVEERTVERRHVASHGDEEALARHESESLAVRAGALLPMTAEVIEYAFRRHLRAATRRRIASASSLRGDQQVVGFADLVRFTSLSQDLDDHSLVRLVDRFETLSAEIVVAGGGRIVKMIGDEAMFAAETPGAAARIGLELSQRFAAEDDLPDVRVGLAAGPVLSRDGDLYGAVVNLASRLVELGAPRSVHLSKELRDAIANDARFRTRSAGLRRLRHIGSVRVYRLYPGPAW